jgi:hypothetical protein
LSYEKLLREADNEGIEIYENNYIGKLKGLYVDNTITINTNVTSSVEKKCILIEELGHHHTSCGDIIDQSKLENRKQERRARAWGYEKLVGITKLIDAFKYGVKNRYELSKYLDVTEEYIEEVLNHYKQKYGLFYQIDNYVVYFEPLAVMEIWE